MIYLTASNEKQSCINCSANKNLQQVLICPEGKTEKISFNLCRECRKYLINILTLHENLEEAKIKEI